MACFSKTSSIVNRPICLQITWNFAISWRKCVFKLRYSFLTKFSLNPKDQWLHCLEPFPAAALWKRNFRCEKCFNATGACSNDAKVTLPGQTDLAWVQLLPHQISLNFQIVFHLAELDVMNKIEKFKMESMWLLYFVLMEISIVGFVFIKRSASIKHSSYIDSNWSSYFIFNSAHDILMEARSSVQ